MWSSVGDGRAVTIEPLIVCPFLSGSFVDLIFALETIIASFNDLNFALEIILASLKQLTLVLVCFLETF